MEATTMEGRGLPDPQDEDEATDSDEGTIDGDHPGSPLSADIQDDGDVFERAVLVATTPSQRKRSSALDIVKVAVTVNGRSQLLELDQSVPLDEVCRTLSAVNGVRWRPGRYALQFVRQGQGHGHGLKYVTEVNRHDMTHGAELLFAYAPDVFSEMIAERLAGRTYSEDWSWALEQLAGVASDRTFLRVFSERVGAIDTVLHFLLSEQKRDRMRSKELLWALRVLLSLLRHRALVGVDPRLVRRVADLVSAEHPVNTVILETSLTILIAVSGQPWDVSVAKHLSVVDVVPLLWDTDRPTVQAGALELINMMAAREARLGPDSPEGRMQVIKTVTSPQVCATIVQNVLCSPVRSTMARQLFLLQTLLLRPLGEAMNSPAHLVDYPPPFKMPRRKTSAAGRRREANSLPTLMHSYSWGGGHGADREVAEGERRSLVETTSAVHLPPTPPPPALLRPAGGGDELTSKRSSGESTVSFHSSGVTADTWSDSSLRGSVTSLSSEGSHRSSGVSTTWTEFLNGAPALSKLGVECLQYLSSHHPTLAVRAAEEEEALLSSLAGTAERLVRLLGAELFLGDHGPGPEEALYQPLVFTPDIPFFHELFCRGLNLLAKTRREMRAKTARDQDKVLHVVRRQFREALGAQVSSWDQLDSWLSALPYSAVAALWEKERASREQDTLFGSAAVHELREHRQQDLHHLVRQQRLATLRAGARFRKVPQQRTHQKGSSKRVFAFVWLTSGDTTLQYAYCSEGGERELRGEPRSLSLASVTSVVTGRKCTHIHSSRRRKQGGDIALSLSLLLDPHDCEEPSLDLIAPDVSTLEAWADGLNMLLGQDILSAAVKRDVDMLMDMEVRLQLMELDGVSPPSEPPPLPPPPPDLDFATA